MAVRVRDASHLLALQTLLGEGPIWIGDALWFVDIKNRLIFRHDPATGAVDRWAAPEFVGWIVPATGGTMIAGLKSGPHRFSPVTGAFDRLATVDAEHPANRLNDAAVHPSGRLYFGTMDNDEERATGRVFVLDCGELSVTAIPPCVITNGPAITPSGDRLFHVDTLARTITAHPVAGDGAIGAGETFVTLRDDEGYADGAICDAEGGVWLGCYAGWAARRFDRDGQLTDVVRFPVANVTKIAIGGPDGRTAYATTARQGLSDQELAEQPLAGDVFTFPVEIGAAPSAVANS